MKILFITFFMFSTIAYAGVDLERNDSQHMKFNNGTQIFETFADRTFTAMVWVKLESTGIGQVVIDKTSDSGVPDQVRSQQFLNISTSDLPRIIWTYHLSIEHEYLLVADSQKITRNVLVHIATVMDDSTQSGKIYMNGVEVSASASIKNDPWTKDFSNTKPLNIGAFNNGGTSGFMDGKTFDARLYNRAMLPDEIAEIYGARGSDGLVTSANGCVFRMLGTAGSEGEIVTDIYNLAINVKGKNVNNATHTGDPLQFESSIR